MKRTAFGEPRPATFDEIAQALDEVDLLAADAQALVQDSREEEDPFTGWTAEISHADLGEPTFGTCGFADRDKLVSGLKALGIGLIEEF